MESVTNVANLMMMIHSMVEVEVFEVPEVDAQVVLALV
jgi:hypothetical protein